MVPVRVELTNFLSHRRPDGTPVVFDFEGAKLWSVSGDNGAGKSAIFDGITWALYGVHRGGRLDAQRLISHGADATSAAFVFEVEGQRQRVQRSLARRGQAKRLAQQWDADTEAWREVPGTSSEAGFGRWRDELVGLSYPAFVHSVLLLQAGSDALIRSGAKDRFEVLAQLVDLSRYQRLERAAQAHASELTGRRRRLDEELEGLEPVRDDERAAATAELARLDAQRTGRARVVEDQIAVLTAARRRDELTQRLERSRAEVEATERLVVDAERIRAEASEHALLSAAEPKLRDGIAALAAARREERAADTARVGAEQVELTRLAQVAEQAREGVREAAREAESATGSAAALVAALPAISVVVDARLELGAAQEEHARVGSVAELEEVLARFRDHLAELEATAAGALAARDAAAQTLAVRQAAGEEAARQLQARHDARDEAVCLRCGQPVDERHRLEELARAEAEVERAELGLAEARERHAAAVEEAKAATAARDEAGGLQRQAEQRRTEAEAVERRVERARAALARALDAASFSGWDDPRRDAFASGGDAEGLAPARAELEAERERLGERAEQLRAAAAEAERLAQVAEDAHVTATRGHAELERTAERASAEAVAQRRQAGVLLDDVPPDWADRAYKDASPEEGPLENAPPEEDVPPGDAPPGDVPPEDVPPEGAPPEDAPPEGTRPDTAREGDDGVIAAFQARRAAVEGAVAELAELERAEGRLATARAQAAELSAQLEGFPEAQRVSVGDAEQTLAAARDELAVAERALGDARLALAALDEREQAREAKLAEQARTGRDARLASRLVQLLSRQGLQGQLLLDATRTLETLANETLSTLTGGALQLEIRFADQRGRDELSVYARDYNAGGERTDAAFLSGSEKFRVCVAMAAAVGAYGSSRSRVESLIIDEGFGSLDEQRRGEMIDELQRLAGLLERVIVVSHQADFHNRAQFPHGYRLRRVGGETTVERYV